jgi:polar amino acid transport system permease protein
MGKLVDFGFAWRILPDLLAAGMTTIGITLAGFSIALAGGLLLALLRRSPLAFVSWPVAAIVEFVRSTPLLIQLYFLFYVMPEFGLMLSAPAAGIAGIGLHYSCYIAEVYRAGLEAVPRGQWEACQALSLPRSVAYRRVILPQAIRPMLPALGNYLVAMFKDTPVLSAITVVELMLQAKNIGSHSFRYLEPITMAGLFFLCVSLLAAALVRKLERATALPATQTRKTA